MEVREGLTYTEQHEWIREDEPGVVVGITDFAQLELGDIVFIELPKVGKKLNSGDVLAVVESTKAASDIYAPIAGTVVQVNDMLKSSPDLVNREPYDNGWIAIIERGISVDRSEEGPRLDSAAYRRYVERK